MHGHTIIISSSKLSHLDYAVTGLPCGKENCWYFELFRLLCGFVFGNRSFDLRCGILSFNLRASEKCCHEGEDVWKMWTFTRWIFCLSDDGRSVGLSRSVYARLVFKVPTPIFRSSLPSAPYHIHLYWFISVVLRLQPSLSILWTLLSFSMFYIVRPDRLNFHSLSRC